MMRDRLNLTFLVVLFSVVFISISLNVPSECRAGTAHNPWQTPPPNVPSAGDKVRPGSSTGNPGDGIPPGNRGPATSPGLPGPSGPSTPNGAPSGSGTGGGTRRTTGKGAFTRKNRSVTSTGDSWQQWWARNRYQFLSFPKVESRSQSRYPATPVATESNPSGHQQRSCIKALRPFLLDRSALVRRAALVGLARLDDERSLPQMIAMLKDPDQTVRRAAILSLGLIRSGQARYTLLHIAQGTEYGSSALSCATVPASERGFAGLALALDEHGRLGPVESIFREMAVDPACDTTVRAIALEGIGLLGNEEAVEFLASVAGDIKEDDRLRSVAITSLGKTQDQRGLPALLRSLAAKSLAVRQSAALAIGYLASPRDSTCVRQLFRCYSRASNSSLKGFTLLAIGQIGGPDAVKRLELVLKRGSSSDLPWACLALGLALRNEPPGAASDLLLHRLNRISNRSHQGAIAIALGLARSFQAVDPLIELLRDGDEPYMRGYCATALGMIGDARAVPALREALTEKNIPCIHTQAAVALCQLSDSRSVPGLLDLLLNSTSKGTQAMASWSLTFLGDGEVVSELLDFIRSKSSTENTCMFSIELIARIVAGHRIPLMDRLAYCSNYNFELPIVAELLDFGV